MQSGALTQAPRDLSKGRETADEVENSTVNRNRRNYEYPLNHKETELS